jgi:hypothetical protein
MATDFDVQIFGYPDIDIRRRRRVATHIRAAAIISMQVAAVSHPEHLHHLIPQVVDHLHRGPATTSQAFGVLEE